MKLIDPNGVHISVSDEKGEELLKKGYRLREEPVPPAPEPKAKSNGVRNNGGRRGPARKTS